MITKSSVMEIQNLAVNLKSQPLSRTLDTYFYLSKFPAKINDKVFQNKEKNPNFSQTDFSLETMAKCNCSGPPAF